MTLSPDGSSHIEQTLASMQRDMDMRDERYVQRHAPKWIAAGYRVEELTLIRSRITFFPSHENRLLLIPTEHLSASRLRMRLVWRRFFPYSHPALKGKQ